MVPHLLIPASKRYCKFKRQDSPTAADDENPQRQFIKEAITKDRVVIFSKTTCPFCVKAKRFFRELKERYNAIELDKRDDGRLIQDMLGEMTGTRTVPRVFVRGKCIGGSLETNVLFNNGRLEKMLNDY